MAAAKLRGWEDKFQQYRIDPEWDGEFDNWFLSQFVELPFEKEYLFDHGERAFLSSFCRVVLRYANEHPDQDLKISVDLANEWHERLSTLHLDLDLADEDLRVEHEEGGQSSDSRTEQDARSETSGDIDVSALPQEFWEYNRTRIEELERELFGNDSEPEAAPTDTYDPKILGDAVERAKARKAARAAKRAQRDEAPVETPNKVDDVGQTHKPVIVPDELEGKVDETFLAAKVVEWERRLAELQAEKARRAERAHHEELDASRGAPSTADEARIRELERTIDEQIIDREIRYERYRQKEERSDKIVAFVWCAVPILAMGSCLWAVVWPRAEIKPLPEIESDFEGQWFSTNGSWLDLNIDKYEKWALWDGQEGTWREEPDGVSLLVGSERTRLQRVKFQDGYLEALCRDDKQIDSCYFLFTIEGAEAAAVEHLGY